jgi:hypothetical protein
MHCPLFISHHTSSWINPKDVPEKKKERETQLKGNCLMLKPENL